MKINTKKSKLLVAQDSDVNEIRRSSLSTTTVNFEKKFSVSVLGDIGHINPNMIQNKMNNVNNYFNINISNDKLNTVNYTNSNNDKIYFNFLFESILLNLIKKSDGHKVGAGNAGVLHFEENEKYSKQKKELFDKLIENEVPFYMVSIIFFSY